MLQRQKRSENVEWEIKHNTFDIFLAKKLAGMDVQGRYGSGVRYIGDSYKASCYGIYFFLLLFPFHL